MIIKAASLLACSGIRHGFFTRQGGVSAGVYESLNGGLGSADAVDAVVTNRARMADHLCVAPSHFLSVYQVHSADVAIVREPWPDGARRKADALVTTTPGLALAVATADCGPLLFVDPDRGVIAAAHAGWRGALGGIVEATAQAMESLGARRESMIAVLGPTISRAAYEVGSDFVQAFRSHQEEHEPYFSSADGRLTFDLPAYIGLRIQAAGLAHFRDLALCTYADPERFYSFRRSTHRGEPDYGRLISAIALL